MSYADWIENYVAAQPGRFVRGKCKEAAEAMTKAFPELRRAAGFVYCGWGRDQHWWCVAPDGSLVDPTREQFDVVFEYEELDLNDPATRELVPIGKCMNCGAPIYLSSPDLYFCSQTCSDETTRAIESLGEEVKR